MKITLPIPPEPLGKPSLADRFWDRTPEQHAFALAKNAVIAGDFDPDRIKLIAVESGVDLFETFRAKWVDLLEEVVFHLGGDVKYEGHEQAFIANVIRSFAIKREEAEQAVMKASRRIFTDLAARVAAKRELTDADVAALDHAGRRLGLTESAREEIVSEACWRVIERHALAIRDDGLVNDEEWSDLATLLRKLRMNVNRGGPIFRDVLLARDRWRVMYGELEPVACPDLTLQKNESVYFRGEADWYEYRKVRQRVDYAGISGRFRIAKGLSFRYGSIGYSAPSVDELKLIRSGELVLTNKRAMLMSSLGDNKAIRWSAVLRVSMESHNTFELEKATGKSPVIDVRGATVGNPFLSAQIACRLLEGSAG
jgi:hypothetical protein